MVLESQVLLWLLVGWAVLGGVCYLCLLTAPLRYFVPERPPGSPPAWLLIQVVGASGGVLAWAFARGDRRGALGLACWFALVFIGMGAAGRNLAGLLFNLCAGVAIAYGIWRRGRGFRSTGWATLARGLRLLSSLAVAICGAAAPVLAIPAVRREAVPEAGPQLEPDAVAALAFLVIGAVVAVVFVRRGGYAGRVMALWWVLCGAWSLAAPDSASVRAAGLAFGFAMAALALSAPLEPLLRIPSPLRLARPRRLDEARVRRICAAFGRDPDEPRIVRRCGSHWEDSLGRSVLRITDIHYDLANALALRGGTTLWREADVAWAMPALLAAMAEPDFNDHAADLVLSKIVWFHRGWRSAGEEPLDPSTLAECQAVFPAGRSPEPLADVLWDLVLADTRGWRGPGGAAWMLPSYLWLAAQVGAIDALASRLRSADDCRALVALRLLDEWLSRPANALEWPDLYWDPSLSPEAEEGLRQALSAETALALLPAATAAAQTPGDRELVERVAARLRTAELDAGTD